jgi:hypothetical protein
MHVQVTIAIHDMNGFAPLAEKLPASLFDKTTAGKGDVNGDHTLILDLFEDDYTHLDEKIIDLDTAAEILGWPAETTIQRGRQILAQINDEDAAMLHARGFVS